VDAPPPDGEDPGDGGSVIPIRGPGSSDDLSEPQPHRATARRSRFRRASTRWQTLFILLITIGAGIAGGIASGAPTDLRPFDIALKTLLPVACVIAGRRTPWPFVALAAAVAATASYHSPAAIVAVAIAGLALAGWRAARQRAERDPDGADRLPVVARAAMCGALADVALRATWPRIALGPSVLAAAIVLLLVVPAIVLAPPRRRRLVISVSALVVLIGLLLSALAGFSILHVRSSLRSALADTSSGLKNAEHGNQSKAIIQFKKADTALSSADGDLSWARAAEVVPIVSQQIRAVRVAASVGTSLVQAGVSTAEGASLAHLKLVDGTFPVKTLESYRPLFQKDLTVISTARRQLGPFSSPWLVAPLRSKLASEESKLDEAQHDAVIAFLGSEEIPGILGADGVRTYLVLVENPAESRANGGVIGDYAEVTADAGRLRLVKVGSVSQLNHDGVPPLKRTLPPIPDFVDRYSSYYPQDHWENIPMTPDFPTVGAVAEYMFPQSGGVKVDGVIKLDPVAMGGLIKMVGAVRTTDPKEILDAKNVVSFLADQEFNAFTNNARRVIFVEDLLKQVWHELTTRSLPPLPTLIKDMEPSVQGGHFEMYSSQPSQEAFFDDVHVAGAMPPVVGDFVGVVTQNNAGNKIDWFLRRSITYDATLNLSTKTITSTLTVALHNSAPTSGLSPLIIDGLKGVPTAPGEDLTWVSIYSPWLLQSATVNGKPVTMTSQFELGRPVYGTVVPIQSDTTVVLQLHLDGTWPASLSHYELGWYHQPVLFPDQVSTKVTVIH
jgi:hypothetical protein